MGECAFSTKASLTTSFHQTHMMARMPAKPSSTPLSPTCMPRIETLCMNMTVPEVSTPAASAPMTGQTLGRTRWKGWGLPPLRSKVGRSDMGCFPLVYFCLFVAVIIIELLGRLLQRARFRAVEGIGERDGFQVLEVGVVGDFRVDVE